MIAALFVAPGGVYAGIEGVDVWDEARDARRYAGPHPVVAHPPCARWGRFALGSPRKPWQYEVGDDNGCFAAALASVRLWGGVLEHPADSKAWLHFRLWEPNRFGGWTLPDEYGGASCYVEQGHYGHPARKPTWLYACEVRFPDLRWGAGGQVLNPEAVRRYGYEKARRIGWAAWIGGKNKTAKREATPEGFRDLLLGMARSVRVSA